MVAHSPPEDDVSNLLWSPRPPPSESPPRRLSPIRSGSGSSIQSSSPSFYQSKTNTSIFSESSQNQHPFFIQGVASIKSRSPHSSPIRSTTVSSATDDQISVDPYTILGLDRDVCNQEDIKKAYRRLALLSHPRRNTPNIHRNRPNLNSNDNSTTSEEKIREWHFVTIAASYETLSIPEHKYAYDQTWRRNQSEYMKEPRRNKFRRKRGFWINLKNNLHMNDSFDKNNNKDDVECCGGSDAQSSNLLYVCGPKITTTTAATPKSIQLVESNNRAAISKLQSTRGGKLLLDCKPLSLSDDEISQRQKSTGTESVFTDDGNEDMVRQETNHLFGGPLAPMYRARQYIPFSDAFGLFNQEFDSDIFRNKSCFDEEDDEEDENDDDDDDDHDFAQAWISGGTGKILNDSKSMTGSMASKPALVYPVLPDIPLEVLEKYGILDGSMRSSNTPNEKTRSNPIDNQFTTEVCHENKNGISSEVTTTSKIHGNMRIVRTHTITTNINTGKKKTVISVRRENLPEQVIDNTPDAFDEKSTSFFELVPCCSFSLPPPLSPPRSKPPCRVRNIPDDDTTVSSYSNSVSTSRFEDKKALKMKMKNLFLKQRQESREDHFNSIH